MAPPSTALLVPSMPRTLLPPPPTLPSGVLSCLKRNTSWLCMKLKWEREIEGNCRDKKALTSQVFSARRPVASAGHLPGAGTTQRGTRVESGELNAGVKGQGLVSGQHHLLLLLLGTKEGTSLQLFVFGSELGGPLVVGRALLKLIYLCIYSTSTS